MSLSSTSTIRGVKRWQLASLLPIVRVLLLVACAAAVAVPPASSALEQEDLAARVAQLTRASQWTRVQTVPMRFRTHHPQGMVKVGGHLFVSSVEVSVPARRYPAPANGLDRDSDPCFGHLFRVDMAGNLIADLTLGEGAIYHPGGIDYDGRHIWVAVAEYRPNSRSIVYRIDPTTMTAVEVLRWADHLGAIVHDTDDDTLHAVNWGARAFYRWSLGANGRVTGGGRAVPSRTPNPSHYLDYQDCKYAGRHRALCTGVTEMRASAEAPPFRLGGIELVHLGDHRPLHQVPVPLWTPRGLSMTHNPVWLEPTSTGLRAYFMPEDDDSSLYVYDVTTPR